MCEKPCASFRPLFFVSPLLSPALVQVVLKRKDLVFPARSTKIQFVSVAVRDSVISVNFALKNTLLTQCPDGRDLFFKSGCCCFWEAHFAPSVFQGLELAMVCVPYSAAKDAHSIYFAFYLFVYILAAGRLPQLICLSIATRFAAVDSISRHSR